MAAISDYLEAKLLDHSLGTTTYAKPAAVYLGIFDSSSTTAQLEANTQTNEITAYASANRPAVTFNAATSPGGSTTNSNTVEYTNMPATTVARVAVLDSATKGGGNVLWYATLDTSKTTNSGDTFRVPAGDLTITLA